MIADEVDGQARHRADLSTYKGVGTGGYRRRRLTRIVDTLHFAPSHASRLVQAVDMVAFLHRRVFTHCEGDERARLAKVAMWDRLRSRVSHEACWFPLNVLERRDLWVVTCEPRCTKSPPRRALRLDRRHVDHPAQAS